MRIRLNIFILLIILLTSCGPAVLPTPIESQVLPEPTTAQIIDPIVWPGLNDGWMTFSKSSPVYKVVLDESGYLWGIRFSDVLRWSAKTGEVIQFTVEMGNLPFNATRIEAFQGNIWIASNNGEIAVFLNDEWVIQRISVGRLYLISVVKDDLWVVGEESAYYFNGNDWNEFLPLRTRDNRWIRQVVKSNDDEFENMYSNSKSILLF